MGQAIHKVGHGLPLFLSFNPFWCTFAVLFVHKNTSTPEEDRIVSHDAFFQKHHAISQS